MKIAQALINRVTLVLAIASAVAHVTAFVSQLPTAPRTATASTRSQALHRMMVDPTAATESFLSASNNMASPLSSLLQDTTNSFLVATIDADIANISDNEFAPIFAGGILVMFGGVLSALIVGFILDSTNSYAEVIADSYAQSAEDEDFWKGLSDEERKKTQELLQKVKEGNEGRGANTNNANNKKEPVVLDTTLAEQATQAMSAQEASATTSQNTEKQSTTKESEKTMFSDY